MVIVDDEYWATVGGAGFITMNSVESLAAARTAETSAEVANPGGSRLAVHLGYYVGTQSR